MRINNLVPVTAKGVITVEMEDYISKYLSTETIMVTTQIEEGAVTIESEYEEALSAPHVIKLAKAAAAEGYDAIFVNCFGDPGVRAVRECVNVPVFGGFEPSIHIAMGLADRVGIVTVVKNVLSIIKGNIAKYHLDKRVISVRSIDMPVLELSNHEKLCEALINECKAAIEEDGVEAIVLGCTGMVDVSEAVRAGICKAGYDIPIIEAAQSALMMLELYAKMGLKHSRLTYMEPPEKE